MACTQYHTVDTTKDILPKCEKGPILPYDLRESLTRAECMGKMGHFLEAKPYFNLHEISFLGWKWFPGVLRSLKCLKYVENNLTLNTHKWILHSWSYF